MENHLELSDLEFMKRFCTCDMDESLFNHEAHVRLAWINIRTSGIEQAIENVSSQIRAYVKHLGVTNIYNHTLTLAAVKVVYHFMLKSNSGTFIAFMNEFPRLNSNFMELIDAHYSTNIFTDELAKTEYLEPDLMPFDI